MRMFTKLAGAIVMFAALPSALYAQASIVGTVKDPSGAVLPGVTVEASSPALIEKVRTVVTNVTGQYEIADLRPGTYTVTFTLTGFTTVKREGIELTGTFAATVNSDLRVGGVEETITVSGGSPVVDLRTTRQQQTMSKDIIEALPTGRQYYSLANLVPSMSTGQRDVGGSVGVSPTALTAIGSKSPDSRLTIDGLNVGAGGGGATMYMTPAAISQEVTFNITGGLGDSDSPGTAINIIPKDGGNTFNGLFFANGASAGMVGNNYTDELKARGLRAPNKLVKAYDVNPAYGGPIVTDRLWFYGSIRATRADNTAGIYLNANAGNVNAWTYVPTTTLAVNDNFYWGGTLRLTLQATPKNKFTVFWDEQKRCVGCDGGGTATQTVEATGRSTASPMRVGQGTWTSPITNRLLAEAGLGFFGHRNTSLPRTDGTWNPLLIPVIEQAGAIPNLSYRAPFPGVFNAAVSNGMYRHDWTAIYPWRVAVSYITGTHSIKVGYDGSIAPRYTEGFCDTCLAYRFSNGVPNQLWELAAPWGAKTYGYGTGFYAQDRWSVSRLSLQGGVRYDGFRVRYPAQGLSPSKFNPVQVSFPESESYNWKDITPRFGVTYDVFGTGKTAAKVTVGKYMANGALTPRGGEVDDFNPVIRMALSTTRSWTDANSNYVADCNLLNPALQDLRSSGGDLCGAVSNSSWGTTKFNSNFDPSFTQGWGTRPYQWLFSPSVQQELRPGVSVNAAYVRRWYGNLAMTKNLAVTPADFDQFGIVAPLDSRLPNGGGYPIAGLVNVKPVSFGQTNTFYTAASSYGSVSEHFHAINVDLNARIRALTVQGGVSYGKQITDNCALIAKAPEVQLPVVTTSLDLRAATINNVWQPGQFCHVETPFLGNYKAVGAYQVPRIDVQLSGTYQNLAGPEQAATYNAPNAPVPGVFAGISSFLGRNLSGNQVSMPIALIVPGSQYGERYNQVDVRVAKVFRFGHTRALLALDLYNALNGNSIVSYNNTFVPGGPWLAPTAIEVPRVFKVGTQIDF